LELYLRGRRPQDHSASWRRSTKKIDDQKDHRSHQFDQWILCLSTRKSYRIVALPDGRRDRMACLSLSGRRRAESEHHILHLMGRRPNFHSTLWLTSLLMARIVKYFYLPMTEGHQSFNAHMNHFIYFDQRIRRILVSEILEAEGRPHLKSIFSLRRSSMTLSRGRRPLFISIHKRWSEGSSWIIFDSLALVNATLTHMAIFIIFIFNAWKATSSLKDGPPEEMNNLKSYVIAIQSNMDGRHRCNPLDRKQPCVASSFENTASSIRDWQDAQKEHSTSMLIVNSSLIGSEGSKINSFSCVARSAPQIDHRGSSNTSSRSKKCFWNQFGSMDQKDPRS